MTLTESAQKLKTGDAAPDFSLKDAEGKTFSLSDFRGKPLLVIFMCNHCPYVKAKTQAMRELKEKFGGKINVVGINSNDPEYDGEGIENMKKFVEEEKINFPYLSDETQETAKSYGASCTPDPFLFDAESKLVFHGMLNDAMNPGDEATENVMEENVKRTLNGEEMENPFRPSIGCSIKWKN